MEIGVRVYYEDTDLAGVVYYANYLKFIERGRSEALRALGIDQTAMKADGLVLVVRRLVADYLAPARYDDILKVVTRVVQIRGASVLMAQEVLRGGTLLFRADVTIACMNLAGRPQRLPADMRRLLATIGS